MPTNKGELEDAIRAIRLQLAKGLGIAPAPNPQWDETSPQVVWANLTSLALSAAVLAGDLAQGGRSLGQAVGVVDSVTPLIRIKRIKASVSETISVVTSATHA